MLLGRKEFKGQQDHRVLLVQLVLLAPQERKGQQDHKDHKVSKDQKATLVIRDLLVPV